MWYQNWSFLTLKAPTEMNARILKPTLGAIFITVGNVGQTTNKISQITRTYLRVDGENQCLEMKILENTI